MSRAVRAENAIAILANEEGLTVDGKLAIENSIDPFPDTRRPTRGWPDAGVSATVTPRDKRSMSVAVKAAYTGLWDCYIIQFPTFYDYAGSGAIATRQTLGAGVPTNVINPSGGSTAPFLCGLCAFTVPAGTTFNPLTWSVNDAAGYSYYSLQTSPNYITDSMRAISAGIEIHNTTAPLNRQGSIVCFRQPMNSSRYSSTYGLSSSVFNGCYGAAGFVTLAGPPQTPSAALAFSDSTQWNAEKGAYIPCALQSMDLPYNANTYTLPAYYNGLPSDLQVVTPSIPLINNVYNVLPRLWTEFAMSGAVLTGLSNSTTLTVNWNVIYEIQAAGQSTLLENIATPSPPLDLKAMRMLSMLHHLLPVAVEVDRNALGDWIASAAAKMQSVISPTLTMIRPMLAKMKHPVAQMVHEAIKERQPKKLAILQASNQAGARARQKVNVVNKQRQITPTSGNAPGSTS
jgi:hypothetical protein